MDQAIAKTASNLKLLTVFKPRSRYELDLHYSIYYIIKIEVAPANWCVLSKRIYGGNL